MVAVLSALVATLCISLAPWPTQTSFCKPSRARSLARSLGAPHHRERKRAPVRKQALVSSVDAQGAERFNVYGPVKSVRPLKGPPASDCVRMCSWRARVCMRMHVLWSVQLRIACAGTAPQVRGHYDDWYVRYKAADGSQVRNGTGCCAEHAMARPDIPTVAAAKLALRLALVTLDVGRCSVGIAWNFHSPGSSSRSTTWRRRR